MISDIELRSFSLHSKVHSNWLRSRKMGSEKEIVIAFDLYGTLLSTESIGKELAVHFGDEKAGVIAALWRRSQLHFVFFLQK